MPQATEIWAQECRDEVKYYRARAAECKSKGLLGARRIYLELALSNRARAKKWSSQVA
ncbi:hypothetical protein M1E08_09570 [Erwinia sp. PK3-005]